jgi:hypothetical protein
VVASTKSLKKRKINKAAQTPPPPPPPPPAEVEEKWITSPPYQITSAWNCQVKLSPEKNFLIDIRKSADDRFAYSRGISMPAYKVHGLIAAVDDVAYQLTLLEGASDKPQTNSIAQIENESQLNVVHVSEFGGGYVCRIVYFIQRSLYYIDIRKVGTTRGACIPASAAINLIAAVHELPALLEKAGYEFE